MLLNDEKQQMKTKENPIKELLSDIISIVSADADVINVVTHNRYWQGAHSRKYLASTQIFRRDEESMTEIHDINTQYFIW